MDANIRRDPIEHAKEEQYCQFEHSTLDVSRHGGIRWFEKTVSSGPPIQNSKLPSEGLFIFFCVKENEPKETARVPLLSALLATGGSCETRCAQTVTVSLRLLLRCSTRPNGKGHFKDERPTSNAEHRTSNEKIKTRGGSGRILSFKHRHRFPSVGHSKFDVGRSMFDVHRFIGSFIIGVQTAGLLAPNSLIA